MNKKLLSLVCGLAGGLNKLNDAVRKLHGTTDKKNGTDITPDNLDSSAKQKTVISLKELPYDDDENNIYPLW
ncbi:MAG: hypothetical protein QGG67_03450 [Gammaproteobacteria bacterium]|jgi:hypothetical protein|nr:hypothetical protein [Gammaproteobacteria bacterium]|tara:strand:- start:335 stop:550 length:216 start_codon:yes stop_codon:yes gene_type:complete